MSHGHAHASTAPAAAVVAEPSAYLADPTSASTTRCKRRWNDVALLRLDVLAPKSYSGANPRFSNEADMYKLLRDRYLTFVKCIESKPGDEPTGPYLYPQPTLKH